jgi:hypothetical protein
VHESGGDVSDPAITPGQDDRPGERIRRRQAISILRARLRAAEETWRHDSGIDHDHVARLEARMEERRRRITGLRYEITAARRRLAELEGEEHRARDELVRYERAAEAILSAAIARVEAAVQPSWTPVPVVGYRLWTIDRLRLRGARVVWDAPVHEAKCTPVPGAVGDVQGVPHADGRCGRLGCGVYALKEAGMLVGSGRSSSASRPGAVFGAVALFGKVVEHELGYRAQRAHAIAAGALWRGRMMVSDDPDWITRLFLEPVAALSEGPPAGSLVEEAPGRSRLATLAAITAHLADMARRFQDRYAAFDDKEQ